MDPEERTGPEQGAGGSRDPTDPKPTEGGLDETAGTREPSAEPAVPRRRGNRHHTARRKNRSRQGAPRGQGQQAQRRGNAAQTQIPRGRTQGKSEAPLVTGEEAAGTPPSSGATQTPAARGRRRSRRSRGAGRLTPREATRGRKGHPEESPLSFGRFVTIAAAVIIAIVILITVF